MNDSFDESGICSPGLLWNTEPIVSYTCRTADVQESNMRVTANEMTLKRINLNTLWPLIDRHVQTRWIIQTGLGKWC